MLDEPTNAIDNTTEAILKSKLKPYLNNRTLLLVTHKSSMLTLVNRLIVLNNGQLVADGPRDEVLRTLSGTT